LQIPPKLRIALCVLVFAFVVFHCFFTGLDRFGFVGPDEPRYASIAREMSRSGDWVTPRLSGSPWFEKPPLYYWSAAIGFNLTSNPEVAGRAPSGAIALLAVLALMLCARWLYGAPTAFALGVMLPATVGMVGFARAAATDMPFTAALTLAMSAAAYLLLGDAPRFTRTSFAAFGISLALAVLAKGPAAILLTGGSIALWALATGNLRRSFRLFNPAATLSFCAVALPWYWLCAARNPEFLRVFFLEHNVERFLTNRYQHQQPFWFFVPILLLAVFPWTLLLIPAASDALGLFHSGAWRKSPAVFFASWVFFPLVFFSASQSKLPGYILPAVPPLVLLLARVFVGGEKAAPSPRAAQFWVATTLLLAGTVPFGAATFLAHSAARRSYWQLPGLDPVLHAIGTALLAGGIAAIAAGLWRRPMVSAVAVSIVLSFSVGVAANHILPLADSAISSRQFSYAVRDRAGSSGITVYQIPRARQLGCEFYLDRPLLDWTPQMTHPGWVITTLNGGEDLKARGLRLEPMVHTPDSGAFLFRVE